MIRYLRAFALVGILAIAAGACSGGGGAQESTNPTAGATGSPQPGGTLLVETNANIATSGFDFQSEYWQLSFQIYRCCLERTLKNYNGLPVDQDGAKVFPDLAAYRAVRPPVPVGKDRSCSPERSGYSSVINHDPRESMARFIRKSGIVQACGPLTLWRLCARELRRDESQVALAESWRRVLVNPRAGDEYVPGRDLSSTTSASDIAWRQ